jgi:hypothetical protein
MPAKWGGVEAESIGGPLRKRSLFGTVTKHHPENGANGFSA